MTKFFVNTLIKGYLFCNWENNRYIGSTPFLRGLYKNDEISALQILNTIF